MGRALGTAHLEMRPAGSTARKPPGGPYSSRQELAPQSRRDSITRRFYVARPSWQVGQDIALHDYYRWQRIRGVELVRLVKYFLKCAELKFFNRRRKAYWKFQHSAISSGTAEPGSTAPQQEEVKALGMSFISPQTWISSELVFLHHQVLPLVHLINPLVI